MRVHRGIPLPSPLSSSSFVAAAPFSTSTMQQDADADDDSFEYDYGPLGTLFEPRPTAASDGAKHQHQHQHHQQPYSDWLMGRSASIRRRFGAGDNAQGLLVCGGSELARHASFDPNYRRAQDWIRHHAVGPAIVSPVLIGGLVGALVEAALPNSVPLHSSTSQIQPLIIGVEVRAEIEITAVEANVAKNSAIHKDVPNREKSDGYQIQMMTKVQRLQDGAMIANGTHSVWIPYTTTMK